MKSKKPSPTIYRDRPIGGRAPASATSVRWPRPGPGDDHAERVEVVLRLLLIICVGAGLLACGAATREPARLVDGARPGAPTLNPARMAAQAATALLPSAVVKATGNL